VNYNQRNNEDRKLKSLIKRLNTQSGSVKIYPNNTLIHETTKTQVVYWLLKNGWKVWTEIEFVNNGGRADIVCISGGIGYIIEILCSESEERYNNKLSKYPREFKMLKINTKDFNYDTFKI
jgi:hypothetical protein